MITLTDFPLAVLGAIPVPPSDSLGPFRLYGLMIALGALAGVFVAQRRWTSWGGDEDDVITVAVWAVPAGLIGARLYHVITDWNSLYADSPLDAFKIWQGGLGIPGGVLLGALVGIIVARRTVPSWRRLADAAAPALPIAQAVGRLGNYFNQELYGRPTDLPWALDVDADVLIVQNPEYPAGTTFHPTFLYEGVWNLALAGLIMWGGTKVVLKPGRWFAVYVTGYGLGRFWVEALRIDNATLVFGVRVNIWMSIAIIVGGLLWLAWSGGPVDRESTARLRRGVDPAVLFAAQTSSNPLPEGDDEHAAAESGGSAGDTDDGPPGDGDSGDGDSGDGDGDSGDGDSADSDTVDDDPVEDDPVDGGPTATRSSDDSEGGGPDAVGEPRPERD